MGSQFAMSVGRKESKGDVDAVVAEIKRRSSIEMKAGQWERDVRKPVALLPMEELVPGFRARRPSKDFIPTTDIRYTDFGKPQVGFADVIPEPPTPRANVDSDYAKANLKSMAMDTHYSDHARRLFPVARAVQSNLEGVRGTSFFDAFSPMGNVRGHFPAYLSTYY